MRLRLISVSYLLVLVVFEIAAGDESYKVLKFGGTVGDYVRFKPDMQAFTDQLSVCSWIRKSRSGNDPTWFSYAASNSLHNEIFLSADGGENYLFNTQTVNLRSTAGVSIGEWYHYCLCWSISSRAGVIYHNGRQTGSFTTPTERRLTLNGYLVLGQDQDTYGGGFQSSQSFGGELFKLNVFSRKLTWTEVSEMYSAGRCSDVEKEHDDTRQLMWEQILLQPKTGNVRTVSEMCAVEKKLQLVEVRLAEKQKELESTQSDLRDTKSGREDIMEQLNHTTIILEKKSSELAVVKSNLQVTTGQLTQMKTQFSQALAELNRTERNLEDAGNRLNETLTDLELKEEELQEIKAGLSGSDCFKVANSSHWDVLHTAPFFDKVLTAEMLEILNRSWEKLGKLNNSRRIEMF